MTASNDSASGIARAVEILRGGGLVAFPTETVYGLGADATNATAVRRIFHAKGRPPTNPLIVHVADAQTAQRYVTHWPAHAQRLARRFWPGPLTLVLPRTETIVPQVTAGLPTVGLRAPDHPLALELLREFDGPIAAPSANRANRISPTTARHVRQELGDSVDLIVDGGACRVGIESTVLDLTQSVPVILRPGQITQEQIAREIGEVSVHTQVIRASQPRSSPGQMPRHYSPQTPTYLFTSADAQRLVKQRTGGPIAWIVLQQPPELSVQPEDRVIQMSGDAPSYAREFYAALREADSSQVKVIFIEKPPNGADWDAIHDRLSRASTPLPDL